MTTYCTAYHEQTKLMLHITHVTGPLRFCDYRKGILISVFDYSDERRMNISYWGTIED